MREGHSSGSVMVRRRSCGRSPLCHWPESFVGMRRQPRLSPWAGAGCSTFQSVGQRSGPGCLRVSGAVAPSAASMLALSRSLLRSIYLDLWQDCVVQGCAVGLLREMQPTPYDESGMRDLNMHARTSRQRQGRMDGSREARCASRSTLDGLSQLTPGADRRSMPWSAGHARLLHPVDAGSSREPPLPP